LSNAYKCHKCGKPIGEVSADARTLRLSVGSVKQAITIVCNCGKRIFWQPKKTVKANY
jgi:DNA-directed RNA polymerase subunit RPC12/RpoP